MRLTVFGANGRLGREVVRAALQRGHEVIAHTRHPGRCPWEGASWVSGEAAEAIKGSECVLATFGPRSPTDLPFCEVQTRIVLDAMWKHAVDRILCVTGAMVGDYPQNRTYLFEQFVGWIQKRYGTTMEDRIKQEALVRSSGVQWTIFKPPRLTMSQRAGRCEVGTEIRVGLLSSISRKDLAQLLVLEAQQNRFIGRCVFAKG